MQMPNEIAIAKPDAAPLGLNQRQARRIGVTWQAVVRGFDRHGEAFQEFCSLKNLSPRGACLSLIRRLAVGASVEIDVRSPLSRKQWLRYFAEVVHVGQPAGPQAIGVRFRSIRPAFVPAAAVVRLRQVTPQAEYIH